MKQKLAPDKKNPLPPKPQIWRFSKNSPEEKKTKIITNLPLRDIVCIINLHCIWLLKSMCVHTTRQQGCCVEITTERASTIRKKIRLIFRNTQSFGQNSYFLIHPLCNTQRLQDFLFHLVKKHWKGNSFIELISIWTGNTSSFGFFC